MVAKQELRRLQVIVPDELVALAMQAADVSASDAVRLGLAQVAGVDAETFAVRRGRPRKAPAQTETLPLGEAIAS